MRNYVIINGVNSLTIQGLAIKIMPPITKPIQRTLREEIDGRDGDLVTELGYGAYDKTIEIGLFGTFDIDEVIAFFNQKGTITFSNELDKVYNFQALEQVDYAELLKFRTANVVLHCQPFKYPTEEEPLEVEYEYVEATGTDITLNDTAGEKFNKIIPKGNTSQDGTPTPTSPQPVHVVSGDNVLSICGKNLLPINIESGSTKNGLTITKNEDGSYTLNGTSTANTTWDLYTGENITIPAGTYTGSIIGRTNIVDGYIRLNNGAYQTIFNNTSDTNTFTINEPFTFNRFYIYIPMGKTFNNQIIKLQLEKGTATTYEPYIGQDYPIYLGVENYLSKGTQLNGFNNNNNVIQQEDNAIAYYFSTSDLPNEITINATNGNRANITYYNSTPNYGVSCQEKSNSNTLPRTITINKTYPYIYIQFSYDETNVTDIQVQEGTKINHTSTTPIELYGIGDYRDKPFKAVVGDETYDSLTDTQKAGLTIGSWYVYKAIGKVVLDGTETGWNEASSVASGTRRFYINFPVYNDLNTGSNIVYILSNKFKGLGWSAIYSNDTTTKNAIASYCNPNNNKILHIRIDDSLAGGVGTFKTWLENNLPVVYYVLATPTTTEITDSTLIEQLEALKNATSYENQTNINQENNDLPFILEVSTLKKGSDGVVIDNTGNIYSKPTIKVEGTGIVDIYLNDVQVFEVDLSEENKITIDTEKMEAYTDTGLANRKVTGDYSTFKLNVGNNTLSFSGALTSATITRYLRWL